MKLLYYSWGANNDKAFIRALINQGNEVIEYNKKCKHYTRDMELAQDMLMFIHSNGIQAVVSFNYFPIISMICNAATIEYYSWVYDCPHHTLYAKSARLTCNKIGVFDYNMAKELKAMGVNTVFHLPLAVDTEAWAKVINGAEDGYFCDVSFVGSLYTGNHDYFDTLNVSDTLRDRTLEVVRRMAFAYEEMVDVPDDLIDLWHSAMEEEQLLLGEDYEYDKVSLVRSAIIDKRCTVLERQELLEAVAKRYGRTFDLYTNSDTLGMRALNECNKGTVSYERQMPLVFNRSKINLNISLRSITSGIPLRVLDIMGAGGFVLTNYQPEIEEYFEDGKEVVMFRSLEDCLSKIEYYLEHEEERKSIAINGLEAVKHRFNYKGKIDMLFRG